MIIRTAKETDFTNIYNLVNIAFQTAQVTDGNEANFVDELRQRKTYLPELEFVAEVDGKLIGHIMLSKQILNLSKGNVNAVMVAPLCVDINYRNKQIGSELMNYALNQAKKLGYESAFLIGNPAYYAKFGFKQINHWHLQNACGVPDEFVLGKELVDNCLENVCGEVNLH